MPDLGDVYEVVDVQDLAGTQCLNVYFYEYAELFVTTTPTYAQVLAENWVDQILPSILDVQTAELTHTAVRVRNLFDPDDQFELTLSEAGAVASAVSSNFMAIAFQLVGATHAVRKGGKRIAGISDDKEVRGVITDGGLITDGTTLATKLTDAVTVGLIIMDPCFIPVLVKRVRSGISPNYEYRLPESQAESIRTTIINSLFEVLLTSQVSRKIGVGA